MPLKPQPYQAFGELLTEGIKQLALQATMRLVQEDLAERLGYSSSAIYAWRRGEHLPEPKVIEQLARIFVEDWQADQQWINIFLEKAGYGPLQAVAALNEELFGSSKLPGRDEGVPAGQRQTEASSGGTPGAGVETNRVESKGSSINGSLFIEALRSWSRDFFRWSDASAHMRSSWAGMAIYILSVLTGRITPRGVLGCLIALALWMATAWLMTPVLQWPLDDANVRWVAFLKYGAATLIIPLLVAAATQPDRHRDFRLERTRQHVTLWFLKWTGALVGFYTFSLIVIGLAVIWSYFSRPTFRTEVAAILGLVPLFWSYVVARRIPADRYKMFEGDLRVHPADPLFFATFICAGPLSALFMDFYYWLISDRTVFPFLVLILGIGIALWEYKKQARQAIPDIAAIALLGFVLPLCLLIAAFFLVSHQPPPSANELPYLFLVSAYVLSGTLLGATLLIRNKPTLTLPGILALLIIPIAALLVLRINLWLGRGFVVMMALIWLLWGRQRFRAYLWVHGSAWGWVVVMGSSLYLLISSIVPLWINMVGFVLISGLLMGWAYRAPEEMQVETDPQ